MADLPPARVTSMRAFLHTGIDYAGPFLVRNSPGRGYKTHKAYIALFVCLCTRAIHLELVHDYSSPAFLAAFDRFISRRGLPSDMYSDNGTTFRGAERQLKQELRNILKNPDNSNHFATQGIEWHFIPPAAPHFGGLWEAGVKGVKHHLMRVLGNVTPTIDEMGTLLCGIEACLNSRPIAPLPDTVDSCDALTPGHFLIGDSSKSIPRLSKIELADNRLSRWDLLRKKYEQF